MQHTITARRMAVAYLVVLGWSCPGVLAQAPAQAIVPPASTAVALFGLDDLLQIARRDSLLLQTARAQALGARAGIESARAYPNPEIEFLAGSNRPRVAGASSGSGSALAFSQRIENPALRVARANAATAVAQGAEIGVWVVENNLVAEVKTRFFETLRREEELDAAREDLVLTGQIRDRILVRTRTGEGARFDLIRAETEVAIAARQVERGQARIAEAKAQLRQSVGASLPENYALIGDFYRRTPQADYAALKDAVLVANPEIKRALAELGRSERQVEVERQSVLPAVSLRLVQEREPEANALRGGVFLGMPLWDRRRGPIDEARAQAIRARSDSELRRFALVQEFEATWQAYQSALKSVQALEGGILQQARAVVDIAEAAFRFGERGILEYLDARRQFRLIRADLIGARFELYAAKSEIERLAARDIKGE